MTQLPTIDMSTKEVSEYLEYFCRNNTAVNGNSKSNFESAHAIDHAGSGGIRCGQGRSCGSHSYICGSRGAVKGRVFQSDIRFYGCRGIGHVKRHLLSIKDQREQMDKNKGGSIFML